MMKRMFLLAVCALISLAGSRSAEAISVTYIDASPWTGLPSVGFNAVNLPAAAPGTGGTLTVNAVGDFDAFNEFADVFLDGGLIGQAGRSQGGSFVGLIGVGILTQTFNITATDLASVLADGQIRISFGPSSFVAGPSVYSGELTYTPVPEPATLTMLGIGAAVYGTVRARRRRVSAA